MKAITLALLAGIALAGVARADQMSGTIKSVDMKKHMITMQDGMSVMAGKHVMLDHYMKGDNVTITTDKDHMATKIVKK